VFGTSTRYFTSKYNQLFVLVAEVDSSVVMTVEHAFVGVPSCTPSAGYVATNDQNQFNFFSSMCSYGAFRVYHIVALPYNPASTRSLTVSSTVATDTLTLTTDYLFYAYFVSSGAGTLANADLVTIAKMLLQSGIYTN
jgi:hypothetical protein